MDNNNLTFRDLGLSEAMLKALEKKGLGYPTTIQAEAIPHFMECKAEPGREGKEEQKAE